MIDCNDITPKTFVTEDLDEDVKRDYITGFKEHFNEYSKFRIDCNEFSEGDSIFDDETSMFADRDDDFKGEEVIEIVQSIPTPFAHIHNPTPSNDKLHRISVISHNEDEDTSERCEINSRVMCNGILNNYKSPSDDTKSSENKIFYSYNKPQKKQKSEKVEPKLINSQKPCKLSLQDKESIASTQDSEYFHINCQNSASECDTGKDKQNQRLKKISKLVDRSIINKSPFPQFHQKYKSSLYGVNLNSDADKHLTKSPKYNLRSKLE